MNANEIPLITSNKLETSITEKKWISSEVEDALNELKSTLQGAAELIQRRPILALASACALGMMGTWAMSARKRRDV